MKTADEFSAGKVLLIDKPLEWSSFQVVNKIRWVIRKRFNIKKIKVGHAGTLDPLATGLLVICTGKETKNIASYQGLEKVYSGIITLGSTTPSYDLETEINASFDTSHLNDELIKEAANQFIGEIEQYPPIFSAIKKDGKRLYEFARSGENVEVSPRKINISSFIITKIDNKDIHFLVTCSKGTYIRSLANDFGKALNCGGHLSKLRREKIGHFDVQDALSIDDFVSTITSE